MFHHGNLKNYLLKVLIHLQHLINSLTPELNYYGTKTRIQFTGSRLKQPKISCTHGNAVNICIVTN